MKIKTFTHSDLDGAGVNYVLRAIFGSENIDTTLTTYAKIDQQLSDFVTSGDYRNYDRVVIGDIAPENQATFALLNQAVLNGANIKLVDDETSTEHAEKKYPWIKTVSKLSAFKSSASFETLALLAKEQKLEPKLYANLLRLCDLIRKYDTWEWKNHPDKDSQPASQLDQLYWLIGYDRFKEMLEAQAYSPAIPDTYKILLDIDDEQKAHYFKKHKKHAKYYPALFEIDGDVYNVVMDFAENYISELGNELLSDYPEANVAMVINADKETISYRSTGKANVQTLATHFGGGGSEQTSGSPLPFDLKHLLIKAYALDEKKEESFEPER